MKRNPDSKTKRRTRAGKQLPPPAPRPGWSTALVMTALLATSLLLQSLLYAPLSAWPLAFVALTPWFIFIARASNATVVYLASYLLGFAFFLINMTWMAPSTVEGYIAMSAYLGVYYALVACPLRHAVRRRRWGLVWVAPVLWVGSEFCRSVVISGFPWFFLGHSPYRVLTLIQVSDLVGAYGVSFVIVAVNGALADVILARSDGDGRDRTAGILTRPRNSVALAAGLVLFTCIYGQIQLRRTTTTPGPLIAVLQQDYPNFVDPEAALQQPGPWQRARSYDAMFPAIQAQEPDLILLPETPWQMALNDEILRLDPDDTQLDRWMRSLARISRESYDMLQRRIAETGAYLVTGGMAIVPTPFSLRAPDKKFNSAYVFNPDGSPPQRYDKTHCVYFGEVVPFRYSRLRFIYLWLEPRMPFSDEGYEYSLEPGTEYRVFTMSPPGEPDRTYRFAVPICYEDVMPYISRRFAIDPDTGEKRIDFLLNISNDGWFVHTNELPQHLAICAFRAVENRVPIARAVNTGISGFIDSTGQIHDLVEVDGRSHGPGIRGHSISRLQIDPRRSLYSRWGDVFAIACALLSLLLYLDYRRVRIVTARAVRSQTESGP
ncbi:MAG: apolipoprotein N-acyltransferase [bacterium]|nr:apolipoprotein N-acyltransferase [bacterium]